MAPIFISAERLSELKLLQRLKIALLGDSHMRRTYREWNTRSQQHLDVCYFGKGGIRSAQLQEFVDNMIAWGPHIVILQIGSNDLEVNKRQSKEAYANPLFNIFQQLEHQGFVTFVVGLPVRYRFRNENFPERVYIQRSRAVNNKLRRNLPGGRYIALPQECYRRTAYYDGVHFHNRCYRDLGIVMRAKIEELLNN